MSILGILLSWPIKYLFSLANVFVSFMTFKCKLFISVFIDCSSSNSALPIFLLTNLFNRSNKSSKLASYPDFDKISLFTIGSWKVKVLILFMFEFLNNVGYLSVIFIEIVCPKSSTAFFTKRFSSLEISRTCFLKLL